MFYECLHSHSRLDTSVASASINSHLTSTVAGVKGVVMFNDGVPAPNLEVHVNSRMKVKTTPRGEYWKLLLPGQYKLNVRHAAKISLNISP